MIDAHAHLDACAEPADALLSRSRAAGVRRVVTIGAGIDSCRAALEIAGGQPDVAAALGIDPHKANEADAGRVDELRELLSHPRAVAVGETGLDYHYGADSKADQRALFEAQLALADELGLPVVIHCREAAADTAALLRGFAGTVILHCFSEPELEADAAEHGWYVSFAGNVTYPRSEDLRRVAERVGGGPLARRDGRALLVPAAACEGEPNEPANVVHTVATLAAVRGEEPSELGERTARNAAAAFGLP